MLPSYTIYDCYLPGKTISSVNDAVTNLVELPAGTAKDNYTLVFSSEDNDGTASVKIAVELVNQLGDFIGADGLIPKGGTFYLIAELSFDGKTSGSAPTGKNVFYKDYVTTANLTIGANSLKHAYYTIPDLRSQDLELGLSVDLSWTPGLVFTKEL